MSEHASGRLHCAVALAAAAILLLEGLGSYTPSLLTWEATVVGGFPEIGGFAEAFQGGVRPLHYALRCLVWDQGLLSAGHTSLFYGAPTYALFHVAGFSPFTFRIAAVVATLLSVLTIYAIGRRHFDPLVGATAALLWATSSPILFYGRYGSSPAGMLLALLLAIASTWRLLAAGTPWWWSGVAATALYAATLQYSPARLVVLFLLVFIPLVWISDRRLGRRELLAAVVLAAAVITVVQAQSRFQGIRNLLYARGEQFFFVAEHPSYAESLFGEPLLGSPPPKGPLDAAGRRELLLRMVAHNVPGLIGVLSPDLSRAPLGDGDGGVLPGLYDAPLLPFIVWGLVLSLRRRRDWRHACLLLWTVAAIGPLLLTNRVDAHRALILVIPVLIWAALGVAEAVRVLGRAGAPRVMQQGIPLLLALVLAAYNWPRLHSMPPARLPEAESLRAVLERVPGRARVGALVNDQQLALVELEWLERGRTHPGRAVDLYSKQLLMRLEDAAAINPNLTARLLALVAAERTLILAPAGSFTRLRSELAGAGISVTEDGTTDLRVLRLEARR